MKCSNTWLSVVMPVFNGSATLETSLASLCDQDEGIEVVLVDQGSADHSVELAKSFSDKLNLRILSTPQHENWVQNTNHAIANAHGTHITMLHQDDVWFPGRATLLRDMSVQYPAAAMWVHNATYIDEKGQHVGRIGPPFGSVARLLESTEVLQHLLVQNTFSLPAIMFRRDANARLDTSLWYTADWDFWLSIARTGQTAWSPEALVGFRIHATSQTLTGSRDPATFLRQLEIPVERHIGAILEGNRNRVERLARASNALNLWLAQRFHGARPSFFRLLKKLICLGPGNWGTFLRSTRIVARVLPRIRLIAKRRH